MCQTLSVLRLKIRKTFLVGLLLKRKKNHNSRLNTSKVHNRITKNSNIKWILVNILSTNEFYIRNLKQKRLMLYHHLIEINLITNHSQNALLLDFYNGAHDK